MRSVAVLILLCMLIQGLGCAGSTSVAERSVLDRYSYKNRLQNTRWHLKNTWGRKRPDRPWNRAMQAAEELLQYEGAATLNGRAASAYAMWIPDKSAMEVYGAWFEALPTVTEIEIRCGADGDLLWTDGISMSSMVGSYVGLTGLGTNGPLMVYGWAVELDPIEDREAIEAIERAEHDELCVRLIRADQEAVPLSAPIRLLSE